MKNFLILLATIFCYMYFVPIINANSSINLILSEVPEYNVRIMEVKDFAGGRSHLENKAFISKSPETPRENLIKEMGEFAKDNNYNCAVIWKDYFVVIWEDREVKKLPAIFVGFMLACYDKDEYKEQLLLE